MATASAEIIDRRGAATYLKALKGNIDKTTGSEIEAVFAGLRAVKLNDPAVLRPLAALQETLRAAAGQAAAAIAALEGGHAAVSETVAAVGAGNAAQSTKFYQDH